MSEEKSKGQQTPPPARPVEKPPKKPEKVVYLGPTLVENDGEFLLQQGAIYSNGLPEKIAKRVEADPDLARLFVPVGKVVGAMNKLADAESELSQLSHKVRKSSLNRRKKAR